jgi:hypothetical protein
MLGLSNSFSKRNKANFIYSTAKIQSGEQERIALKSIYVTHGFILGIIRNKTARAGAIFSPEGIPVMHSILEL